MAHADTPAGWYSDPDQPSMLRYWDGARWTEHRAPAQTQPTPATMQPPDTHAPPAPSEVPASAAAWLPDPHNPRMLRYWDGTSWTSHHSPLPAGPVAPPSQSSGFGWTFTLVLGLTVAAVIVIALFSAALSHDGPSTSSMPTS